MIIAQADLRAANDTSLPIEFYVREHKGIYFTANHVDWTFRLFNRKAHSVLRPFLTCTSESENQKNRFSDRKCKNRLLCVSENMRKNTAFLPESSIFFRFRFPNRKIDAIFRVGSWKSENICPFSDSKATLKAVSYVWVGIGKWSCDWPLKKQLFLTCYGLEV